MLRNSTLLTPLQHPVWEGRLQLLWIMLATVYVGVGRAFPERTASSLLIVVAGVLVVALLARVLVETDQEKARTTLVVAVGSTIFIVDISANTFGDILGASFGILFSLMFGSLLWFSDGSLRRHALKYSYFVGMVCSVIAGWLCFPVTLMIKSALDAADSEHLYFIGAQGIGALAGLCVGLSVGGRALPYSMPIYDRPEPLGPIDIVIRALMSSVLMVGLIGTIYYDRLLAITGSSVKGILALWLYGLAVVLPMISFLQIFCGWSRRGRVRPWRVALCLVGLAVAISLFNSALLNLAVAKPEARAYDLRLFLVEAPAAISYVGSIFLGFVILRAIAWKMISPRHASSEDSLDNPNEEASFG